MKAPLSWLKNYVDITLPTRELGEKLTEVGLGTERIIEEKGDTVLELEITPNRPDLLSILGIAREIAAVEQKKIKYPETKTDLTKIKPIEKLPLKIKTDPAINPRFSGIIIDKIKVQESPNWLKKYLELMGQRSISNIVDITNFVMLELGNPLHAFDYDKIAGHIMTVDLAKEGEKFTSVDGISYHLPKGTVIIRDSEKIIDLCGLKGGSNSGTYDETKTIFLRVPVENPVLIRRTSQFLGLRSEASSIFERGVNAGGTIDALNRAVDLILEYAGGEIASELYDLKAESFTPWKLKLRLERLSFILGITIDTQTVLKILDSLYLSPKLEGKGITVIVPTYRNDLKIEEDLIEEVARIYGYNNFPKTLPIGEIPTQTIPYFKDYEIERKLKCILTGAGFSEVYTYSLISESGLNSIEIDTENVLRVDNPVSKEFEYLRPTLKANLISALNENKPFFNNINLFETGKIFSGNNIKDMKEEYVISGISNNKSYFEIKGLLERIFYDFQVNANPTDFIEVINEGIYFSFPFNIITEKAKSYRKFVPLPKYPPVIEDMAFIVPEDVQVGDIIKTIQKQSTLIKDVQLHDKYQNARTFRIFYQSPEKNLTTNEIKSTREKIINTLKDRYQIRIKS